MNTTNTIWTLASGSERFYYHRLKEAAFGAGHCGRRRSVMYNLCNLMLPSGQAYLGDTEDNGICWIMLYLLR